MKTRTLRIAALCLAFVLLAAGLVRTLLHPVTEIYYENRPANRIGALTGAALLDGSFQASVEDALADQAPAAVKMKKFYNILDAKLSLPIAQKLAAAGRYVGYRKICFFRDMLVLRPETPQDRAELLDTARELINAWSVALPETELYLYYIETDRDIDLQTGEKSGIYAYLTDGLALPKERVGKLNIESFDDYRRDFLGTDHHWNAVGAYRAYLQLCQMLELKPLETDGIYTDHGHYLGTRAAGIEGVAPEDFSVVLYRYAPIAVSSCGNVFEDYGMQQQFINGELPGFSYGTVFGGDGGEILLDAGGEGRTALILGDSYDNAILKALASGFGKTWSVDLRAYHHDTGKIFDLPSFVAEHDVDVVLFIGGVDFYSSTLLLS